jgi:hypothetical protein
MEQGPQLLPASPQRPRATCAAGKSIKTKGPQAATRPRKAKGPQAADDSRKKQKDRKRLMIPGKSKRTASG